MATQELKVPDIGDFKDIPVIEILVKVGDTVAKDQSIVTLESDKASLDVPSPLDGVVRELKVNVGDKVEEQQVLAMVETAKALTEICADRNGVIAARTLNQDGEAVQTVSHTVMVPRRPPA